MEGLIFYNKDGHKIVYDYIDNSSESEDTIIYLSGLMSGREASKALFFKDFCQKNKLSYLAFDYLGHGDSDLKFEQCTIDTWIENSVDIIKHTCKGQAIIIGSSLGGWIMFRLLEKIQDRIKALIGISIAPDFTSELMWNNFSTEIKNKIKNGNIYHLKEDNCQYSYPISYELIESGQNNLILDKKIKCDIPIRLFHSKIDKDVPYKYCIAISKLLINDDVLVKLIADGDHRLSRKEDLDKIIYEIKKIITPI